MMDAMFNYVMPPILNNINLELDNDNTVMIGNRALTRSYITISVPGWFGSTRHLGNYSRLCGVVAFGCKVLSQCGELIHARYGT